MTENNSLPLKSELTISRLMMSQSAALFGSGLVFPFYLIFIKDIGAGFTEYGLAYGLFTISSSLLHAWLGAWSDQHGRKRLLLWSAWGMAVLFLCFPVVTGIAQVYVLQVLMGLCGAMQKTGEKALLADVTESASRGRQIGAYHGWVGLFSGLAVIAGGFLIDFFTLDLIFYIGSLWMFVSGLLLLRMKEIK